VERLLIAIGVILAFVILVALLPKKLSLTEVDRPSLAISVSPERITVDAVELLTR
jgi:hypothetical protein